MKALILAAGLGTRLRPFTNRTPKPLFPVNGRPLLDLLIHQLLAAGCTAIAVNTHHLYDQIDAYLASQSYGIPVVTRHEPELLGTGGAIKNLSDFWDEEPFLVVNSDILTDIDFRSVYEFHVRHNPPATLVLVDTPPLNSVTVDTDNYIERFLSPAESSECPDRETYTFTGIQVIDPQLLRLIPEKGDFSSIDVYRALITGNTPPKAYLARSCQWTDLGTPARYKTAARDALAQDAIQKAFGQPGIDALEWALLDGDGSDRSWYRLRAGEVSLIASDHGLKPVPGPSEVDSFVTIGRHLHHLSLPVPRIYAYDLFSGWVVMEDLGDRHLQTVVRETETPDAFGTLYREVLDILIQFSTRGIEGFDPAWTCQTAAYDRPLILDRECAYFVNAFLRGYLGLDVTIQAFDAAFETLADGAMEGAATGLMHRDFQSRNILIHHGKPRIIDFQGARRGPIQYDIASLLIDPYAGLSETMQETLLEYAMAQLSEKTEIDPDRFRRCYTFCRITRNLQMLGAFGFLTKVKGKQQFEQYIPAAVKTLKRNLAQIDLPGVSRLREVVDGIQL